MPKPAPGRVHSHRETQAVLEVFKFWQTQTGRNKTRLVPERRDKIKARLRQGFTIQDLKDAVVGATLSEHHSKNQEWLDLTTEEERDEALLKKYGLDKETLEGWT